MIVQMTRVEIVFLRSELGEMVPCLQEQGVVHLESVPLALENHPDYLDRVYLPEEEKNELNALQSLGALLKEILPLLNVRPRHGDIVAAGSKLTENGKPARAEWGKKVQGWHRELRSMNRRKLNIQDNVEVLRNYGAMLRILAPLLAERGAVLGETARAMVLDGYGRDELDALEKRLMGRVGMECRVVYHRLGRAAMSVGLGRNCVLAVVSHPADKADTVGMVLRGESIATVHAPDKDIQGTSVEEALGKIEGKIAALKTGLERITSDLDAYSRAHGPEMVALEKVLTNRIAQLRVVEQFAQSQMITVAHGWVPSDEYDALCSAIHATFGPRAAIQRLSHSDVDLRHIPTLLKNPKIVKPFERIMSLLKPPTYGTHDPTWLVGLSFIVFYGFILGDVGYGLVMVALGAWVKSKWRHLEVLRDTMIIFQWMGASSVVFGLIYLEIFGNFVEKVTGWHALFHRASEVDALLALAITFGLIHVPLSLFIGIREGYRHGHLKHAREKLAMLLGLIALGVALLTSSGALPVAPRTGYVLAALVFVAAVFNFIRGMGAMAPIGVLEIVGLCANILSYSRLMALGIASIAFADIANMLPDMLGGGIMGLLLGVPLAFAVHALNIGIGVFSPTIHSLRLNIVEFMPKFYQPEGRRYEPFRKELAW